MRLILILLIGIMGPLCGAQNASELPELDPLLAALGRPVRWQEGADGRLRFHPAMNGDAAGIPFLSLPGETRGLSPIDVVIIGGPMAMTGLVFSGGRDLASLGDVVTHARRLGWDVSEEALRKRMSTAAKPLERLIAFRLIEVYHPAAVADLRAGLASERDVFLRQAAQPRLEIGHQDLAVVVPSSAILRIVYRPCFYPAQTHGMGAGRHFGVVACLRTLDQNQKLPIDPDILADQAFDVDAAGEIPIAFSAHFGNARIDRVVAWMWTHQEKAKWGFHVDGAVGEAVGRAVEAWNGPAQPTAGGRRWTLGDWWLEVAGDALMRFGMRGEPPQLKEPGLHWDVPDRQSALCITAGATALINAPRLLDLYWVDENGKHDHPATPPALAGLLQGDQTASIDVSFDGTDTRWEIRAPGVEESRMLALCGWLEEWLPTQPHPSRLLARQADGLLARLERRGSDIVLCYRTPGAPLRDRLNDPGALIRATIPDWADMLKRLIERARK